MARPVPEINAGSMADIAFLLLIFFLVTTTMDSDLGIARLLPPLDPDQHNEQTVDVNKRNVFIININYRNELQVGGDVMQIGQLKDAVKEFILNPTDNPKLSGKKEVDVEYFGKVEVSRGVISLTNDLGTSYKTYVEVQNEVTQAINDLRDKLSKEKFGKIYDKLSESEQDAVKEIYPMAISEAEPKNVGGKP
jgi:biopolymer transport protein ExbD